MARVGMIAWYGYSYSPGSIHDPDSVETFGSIRDAADTFAARLSGDRMFPATNPESATAHLYLLDKNEKCANTDYPDYEVTIGPRGGVRVARV